MTNDLFRDLLEERPGRTATDWKKKVEAAGNDPQRVEQRRQIPAAFTVPRARALRHKQQQGHGPEDGLLRNRGRINYYREKG